jgi:hypothetical protein
MEESLALHQAQARALEIAAERHQPVWIHDHPGTHLFGLALVPQMVPSTAQYRQKVLPPINQSKP